MKIVPKLHGEKERVRAIKSSMKRKTNLERRKEEEGIEG